MRCTVYFGSKTREAMNTRIDELLTLDLVGQSSFIYALQAFSHAAFERKLLLLPPQPP